MSLFIVRIRNILILISNRNNQIKQSKYKLQMRLVTPDVDLYLEPLLASMLLQYVVRGQDD